MNAHPSIEADAASHSHKGTLCIETCKPFDCSKLEQWVLGLTL